MKILLACILLQVLFDSANLQFFKKTVFVFYDDIRDCDNFCSGDECFDFYDFSNFKIILDEEDEHAAYLNGSWKLNVRLESPIHVNIWLEKRYGTKWSTELFNRRYNDACKNFRDPLDPAYEFFLDQKDCPYDANSSMTWNMHKINFPSIPPNFIGEWRVNTGIVHEYQGNVLKQCKYLRFDIHEV